MLHGYCTVRMTCVEPGRKTPYSVDLRWTVVWQRIVNDQSFVEIATRLGIASSTAHRTFMQFLQTGDVEPKGNSGPRRDIRKLDDYMEMFIIGLVMETPELYLKEVCIKIKEYSGQVVCRSTVCQLLHRHGFTRKKIRQVALQRDVRLRGQFMAKALLYPKASYVWLDESGCDNRSYIRSMVIQLKEQSHHVVDYWSGVRECLPLQL